MFLHTSGRFLAALSFAAPCLSVLAGCAVRPAPPAARVTPNVVLIYIDDLGYADVGPFGAQRYRTPSIDRMAAEGRRFTDFYVSQAVCSASRASLMTGCYSGRVGILGALMPNARHGIHEDETTLAEVCKQRGYATACYGKWHLGHHRRFLPLQHGFDEYFGLPYSNDMWPHHPEVASLSQAARRKRWPPLPLIEQNEVVDADVSSDDQATLTRRYTEHAVSFIERNRSKPFFLYLAHSMVHVPLHVGDRFRGKSGAGLFGDVMMEVDWSVGAVLDALRRHGLAENTLVIFTSDNGPWLSYGDHAGSAAPLREGKGTMFDGGCRVPTVMWWPGRIPSGTTCRTPAMTIDVLPTVAKLIGADLPQRRIDGRDIWPLVVGEAGARSPHEAYYLYYGRQLQAVRAGRYKLHFPHPYRTLNGRRGGTGGRPVPYDQAEIGSALFDLEVDPGETRDVRDAHPEVVARLSQLAEVMRADLGDRGRRGAGERAPGRL